MRSAGPANSSPDLRQSARTPHNAALHIIAHVRRPTGQVDPGAGRHRDHDCSFIAWSTRRSAPWLTKASTLTRAPPGRSISITPARSSTFGAEGLVECNGDSPGAG